MFTSLELEVEGSNVWQGNHWRTNQCLHHWFQFSWRWREVRCGRVTTGGPMFTSLELEVEGSKVWQGRHWRTNQCLHHWYDSAGGGGK